MVRDYAITVISLRAEGYTPDGKNIVISLTTKYSALERKYSVPVECFADLIVDLQRVKASRDHASTKAGIQPTVAPGPGDPLKENLETLPRLRTDAG